MTKAPLLLFFILAIISLLFASALCPWVRFTTFAPFFAFLFQRKSLLTSLWITTLSGLTIDFLASNTHFGIFCFCSFVTSLAAYPLRKYFFEEKFHSIPLYTAVISFIFSSIQLLLIHEYFTMTLFSSLLLMPLIDALYGFVWFTCPGMLYCLMRRKYEH